MDSNLKKAITLFETFHHERRDPFSRIERRLHNKLVPPVRDVLRGRYARMRADAKSRLANVQSGPLSYLSTRLRKR